MFNVLIVDDEVLVRANIKLLIDWNTGDFFLCGEASNGIEALNMIETANPDIVICDMKMPGMDGLELSSELKKAYPQIVIIVLSNYDDFEYVRGALKNGAVDYILKHQLDKGILMDVLLKAKDLLYATRSKAANDPVESKTPNNIIALRKKFIIQLLTGLFKHENEIKKHFKLLEINIDTSNIIPMVMAIDNYHSLVADGSLKDRDLIEFAVLNIAQEILGDFGNGVVCHVSNGIFSILLSFLNVRSTAAIDNYINSLISRIGVCMSNFLNITVSFSIGALCSKIANLSESYENAEKLITEKFYHGKNCILRASDRFSFNNVLTGLDFDTEKQIITSIKLLNKEKLQNILQDICNYIKQEKLNLTSSQMIFTDLLGIINKICKEYNIELSLIYYDNIAAYDLLARLETLDEIHQWFLKVFDKLLSVLAQDSTNTNSDIVKKAIGYMKKNYQNNISLQTAADEIGISNAYLSTMFKAEMKIGFLDYLTNLRLEKAQILLTQGSHDIRDVVRLCGFNDYSYFFKIFKKNFGITPKEYIKRKQE